MYLFSDVYVFNILCGGEDGFIQNISESYQNLPSSNYHVSDRNFLLLQCGKDRVRQSLQQSAISHLVMVKNAEKFWVEFCWAVVGVDTVLLHANSPSSPRF